MNIVSKLGLLSIVLALAACGSLTHRRGDTSYDPQGHRTLMDQIPAWEGAANEICCGHLRSCKPHQSPRC
jgi:hypothetical protein